MRRRRQRQASQYRPPMVAGGPVSSPPSNKHGTTHAGGGSHHQLYRPASPPPPGPSLRDQGSSAGVGRKRRSPGCDLVIGGVNGSSGGSGGAYLAGPLTFPPKDASPDEIVRWFLGQRDDDASNDSHDGDDDDIKKNESARDKIKGVKLDESETMRRLEAHRRARNRYLASQIDSGGARIDVDGRIVPTADDPAPAGDRDDDGAEEQDAASRNHIHGNGLADNGGNSGGNQLDANDDARFAPNFGLGVRQGRFSHNSGIGDGQQRPDRRMPNPNDEDVVFIPLPGSAVANANGDDNGSRNRNATPRGRRRQQPRADAAAAAAAEPHPNVEPPVAQPPPSLTFRRICFAVFAVVTAFVCIMLQTLPLLEGPRTIDPVLDPVLKEILVLRDMADHLVSCGDLQRNQPMFGFSAIISGRGNDCKTNGVIEQEADESYLEAPAFLDKKRPLTSSHRLPTVREAWASLVALSMYSFGLLRYCTSYPFTLSSDRRLNCQEGVVHIPSVTVLKERYEEALIRDWAWQYPSEWPNLQEMTEAEKKDARELKEMYASYKDGVDLAWSLPCVGGGRGDRRVDGDRALGEDRSSSCPLSITPVDSDSPRPTLVQRFKGKFLSKETSSSNRTCAVNPMPECFRGISDGIITQDEVDAALRLASDLIANGGDHLQLRRDVQSLRRYLPSVLGKVEGRFWERHGVTCRLEPVAFRIFATLPMEGEPLSTPLAGSIHSKYTVTKRRAQLTSAVNHTVYHEWEAKNRDRNDQAPFHLLRQLRTLSQKRPFRDPCVLVSDRQGSPAFSYHSSIFLSDGAGGDHSGGTELYADAHRRNKNPRRRIRRGIIIDPSRGRMVLSSGGDENKHCKMPMRAGIRAVLQIWWDCR